MNKKIEVSITVTGTALHADKFVDNTVRRRLMLDALKEIEDDKERNGNTSYVVVIHPLSVLPANKYIGLEKVVIGRGEVLSTEAFNNRKHSAVQMMFRNPNYRFDYE